MNGQILHGDGWGLECQAGAPGGRRGRSEGVDESRVPERVAKTRPIKAPAADVARATAGIGNAERGVVSEFGK